MGAQAPTHPDPLLDAAKTARKSTKRVRNAARDLDRDLARLDEQLANHWGFGFVAEPTPDTTTAREGEGDQPDE
jgi:hypothetical protein